MPSRSGKRALQTEGLLEVDGLAELEANLAKLEYQTRAQAAGKALLKAAEPIRQTAADLTPRSSTAGGTTGKGHAADHIAAVHRRDDEVHIGPEADFWYLIFVELGTPYTPAVAPLRKAADREFQAAVKLFRDELERAIRQAL